MYGKIRSAFVGVSAINRRIDYPEIKSISGNKCDSLSLLIDTHSRHGIIHRGLHSVEEICQALRTIHIVE